VAVVRARRPGRALRVRRAVGARPGAMLDRVAFARRVATDRARRLEGVRGANRARSGAELGSAACRGRGPGPGPGGPRLVLAVIAAAVARVAAARVAVVRARRPRRGLRVRRAVGACPGAVLRRVAFARRVATDRARRLEGVRGANRARSGA